MTYTVALQLPLVLALCFILRRLITMYNVLEQLKNPELLVARSEVIGKSTQVPKESGIYAWYFKSLPHTDINEIDGLHLHKGWYLLYVGISPSKPPANGKPPSKGTLRRRINNHMKGNASTSTLRLSLGCLLSESLGIELSQVKKKFNFLLDESKLSDWLEKNVKVTWVTHNEPWMIEEDVIFSLKPPLILRDNPGNPFYKTLYIARKEVRDKARKLATLITL